MKLQSHIKIHVWKKIHYEKEQTCELYPHSLVKNYDNIHLSIKYILKVTKTLQNCILRFDLSPL